jgi:hypothetical protein
MLSAEAAAAGEGENEEAREEEDGGFVFMAADSIRSTIRCRSPTVSPRAAADPPAAERRVR